jgi:flagellar biosynthetic protein FliR
MTDIDPQALGGSLPEWSFALMLVLSRVGSVCMLLPGLGEAEVPMNIRAGMALLVTVLVLPLIMPGLPAAPASPVALLGWIAGEIAVGLWLGWLARLPMLALPIAGQFAAGALGLSNVLQPDPLLGPQASALSRLFSLAAPVLLLTSGLYALPLTALVASYHLFRPGVWLSGGDLALSVTDALSDSFALSVQLAAPFVAAGIVWQIALGVLARLVPQLQVYFAALPGQILGGLVLLALLSAGMMETWQTALATNSPFGGMR